MKSPIGLLLVFIMMSCSGQQREIHRPDNVHVNAQWIGGKDGGVWIYIDDRLDGNTFNITIWFERGQVWVSGKHKLHCPCKTNSYSIEEVYELANSYTANMLKLSERCNGIPCYLELIES